MGVGTVGGMRGGGKGAAVRAWAGPARVLRRALVSLAGAALTTAWAAPPPSGPVQRDLAYGPDAAQRLDVYRPPGPAAAGVLVYVHGGGWRIGDKGHARGIAPKVAHWVPRGLWLVSVNYRLLPQAGPLEQARDVARALAFVQAQAPGWSPAWAGTAPRIVLVGHSAGAHLVALLAADPALAAAQGAQPWQGTVALDSAALDVEAIMRARHPRLYDQAFGSDLAYWRRVSPLQRLAGVPAPLLLVCSTQRKAACPPARQFAERATALGGRAELLPVDLDHGEINQRLGEPGAYTDAVDRFLRTLGLP